MYYTCTIHALRMYIIIYLMDGRILGKILAANGDPITLRRRRSTPLTSISIQHPHSPPFLLPPHPHLHTYTHTHTNTHTHTHIHSHTYTHTHTNTHTHTHIHSHTYTHIPVPKYATLGSKSQWALYLEPRPVFSCGSTGPPSPSLRQDDRLGCRCCPAPAHLSAASL